MSHRSLRDSHTDRYMRAERMVSGFAFATLGDTIPACSEDWTDAVLQRIDDLDAIERAIQIRRGVRKPEPIREGTLKYWLQPAKKKTPEEKAAEREARAERRRIAKELQAKKIEDERIREAEAERIRNDPVARSRATAFECIEMERKRAYTNPGDRSRAHLVLKHFRIYGPYEGLTDLQLDEWIGLPVIVRIARVILERPPEKWLDDIGLLLSRGTTIDAPRP